MCQDSYQYILKVLIATSDTAAFVHFVFLLLFARAEPGLPWKITVLYIKESRVEIVIKRLFAAHDLVLM